MRERLIWFFNNDCEYCVDLEPEVKEYATHIGAEFTPVMCGIIDPETGEAQVPALMLTRPQVENHIFLGRFCLDALRYTLANG